MATEKFETLSRFMDNDVSGQDADLLLGKLSGDRELQQRWARYHLIGDALRNELPAAMPSAAFNTRLQQALQQEPVHFHPARRRTGGQREWVGFAMAASITAVAVVAMLKMNDVDQGAGPASQTLAAAMPAAIDDARPVAQLAARVTTAAKVDFVASHQQGSDTPLIQMASAGEMVNMQAEHSRAVNFETSMYDYLVDYTRYAVATPLEGASIVGYYSQK
ncbi:MAG: sigma-E factor negative regulatory protein [Gammaproteobacteria bacterium]|nr:sigma-E factor negative regulatory protein [Gammaproteobacteria bacterium]